MNSNSPIPPLRDLPTRRQQQRKEHLLAEISRAEGHHTRQFGSSVSRRQARFAVVGAVSLVLLATAFASLMRDTSSSSRVAASHHRTVYTPLTAGNLDRLYPMDTLADVREHSDEIILGTVMKEGELPVRKTLSPTEELVGRRITVRVDQVLWQRESAAAVPETVTTSGGSWVVTDKGRSPLFYFGDVGTQYVFVLQLGDGDPVNTAAYEWVQEGTLGVPVQYGRTPTVIKSVKPFLAAIEDKTPDQLKSLFDEKLGNGSWKKVRDS